MKVAVENTNRSVAHETFSLLQLTKITRLHKLFLLTSFNRAFSDTNADHTRPRKLASNLKLNFLDESSSPQKLKN